MGGRSCLYRYILISVRVVRAKFCCCSACFLVVLIHQEYPLKQNVANRACCIIKQSRVSSRCLCLTPCLNEPSQYIKRSLQFFKFSFPHSVLLLEYVTDWRRFCVQAQPSLRDFHKVWCLSAVWMGQFDLLTIIFNNNNRILSIAFSFFCIPWRTNSSLTYWMLIFWTRNRKWLLGILFSRNFHRAGKLLWGIFL